MADINESYIRLKYIDRRDSLIENGRIKDDEDEDWAVWQLVKQYEKEAEMENDFDTLRRVMRRWFNGRMKKKGKKAH